MSSPSADPATALSAALTAPSRPQDTRGKMARTSRTSRSTRSTCSDRSASPSSSSCTHPYLGERKASDIASWTAGVPSKSTDPNGFVSDEVNPAVQAYMQMKLALFQSMSRPEQDDRTSSSSARSK